MDSSFSSKGLSDTSSTITALWQVKSDLSSRQTATASFLREASLTPHTSQSCLENDTYCSINMQNQQFPGTL